MGIPGQFRGVFSFRFSVFSGEQPNRRRSSVAWWPRLPRNGSRIGNRESRMPSGLPQLGLGTRHSKQGCSGWDGFRRLKPGLHTLRARSVSGWPTGLFLAGSSAHPGVSTGGTQRRTDSPAEARRNLKNARSGPWTCPQWVPPILGTSQISPERITFTIPVLRVPARQTREGIGLGQSGGLPPT